jgi:hypothetical protein
MVSMLIKKGDLCNQRFWRSNMVNDKTSFTIGLSSGVTLIFDDIEALDEFAKKLEQEITDYQLSIQASLFNNNQELSIANQGGTSHFE